VVVDTVLVVGRSNARLFRNHDNLIVRLLWPLISTAILIATLVTFLS
jgi:hypothetical protein